MKMEVAGSIETLVPYTYTCGIIPHVTSLSMLISTKTSNFAILMRVEHKVC
jgi:hypothetical protein